MVMSEFSNDPSYNFYFLSELPDPSWYLVHCTLFKSPI